MGASIKELDRRLKSVKNTQQITRAMKMVAAAKLRRSQDRMLAGRPYAETLQALLSTLSKKGIDHPLFETREVKRRVVLIASSDKGLCGGYNSSIIRESEKWLKANADVDTQLYLVGRKASEYFGRRGYPVHTAIEDVNGSIDLVRFNAIADELMQMYLDGSVDEVVVFHTRFISTLSNVPHRSVLLPLSAVAGPDDEEESKGTSGEYLYVPDAEGVLDMLLPKSVRNQVYHNLAEAITSEHGSRMTSMGNATDNAGELIETLTLVRNRARQAAITQEISEIVGGADAIS